MGPVTEESVAPNILTFSVKISIVLFVPIIVAFLLPAFKVLLLPLTNEFSVCVWTVLLLPATKTKPTESSNWFSPNAILDWSAVTEAGIFQVTEPVSLLLNTAKPSLNPACWTKP